MTRLRRHRNQLASGFTLIELMVTVAVVAILAAVAYPSMTSLFNSQRLSSVSNELIGGLQIARSEAIRRNARVGLCRSADGISCATGGAWPGWAVVADSNRDGTLDEGIKGAVFTAPVTVTNSAAISSNTILFLPDGLARQGTTVDSALLAATVSVCVPKNSPKQNRRVIAIDAGSRVTTSHAGTGDGQC